MAALPLRRVDDDVDSHHASENATETASGTVASRAADTASAGETRPNLVVVTRRRPWTAVVIGLVSGLVIVGMFGAAVFHTQLAERQLRIDRLERAVTLERERFDELRHRRAELRSPAYLDTVSTDLNMIRGKTGEFLRVTPEQLARQIAAAGVIEEKVVRIVAADDPLDQFRDVKAVSEGQP